MGRAGQKVLKDEDGLQDRVSVGLLARAFPRATVEAVIEAAGAREQRTRMLPSWLVVYYVLALALFMDMGPGTEARRHLIDAHEELQAAVTRARQHHATWA